MTSYESFEKAFQDEAEDFKEQYGPEEDMDDEDFEHVVKWEKA